MPIRRTLIALSFIVLGACNPTTSGLHSDVDPAWTIAVQGADAATIAETDGVVLASSKALSSLIAIELSTGRQLWSAEVGGGNVDSRDGVTLAQRLRVREGDPAEVVALDTHQGTQLWRSANWLASPPPRLRAGLAIGLTTDSKFEAVDARTGELVYVFDLAQEGVSAEDAKDGWASAITDRGIMGFRPAGSTMFVVDFRAKRVQKIEAPRMDYRSGIGAFGERVIVWGDSRAEPTDADAEDYWIQAFDVTEGKLGWSRNGPQRIPRRMIRGADNNLLLFDSSANDQKDATLRLVDVDTGKDVGRPTHCYDQLSVGLGEGFGEVAVFRPGPDGKDLKALVISQWGEKWVVDSGDPDAFRGRFVASKGFVIMHTDTMTTELGKSYASESRITAFDLEAGKRVWRYVGEPLVAVYGAGDFAVGIGSNRVVAIRVASAP